MLSALMVLAMQAATPSGPWDNYVVQSTVNGGMLAQICTVERDLKLDSCNSFILGAADGLAIGREVCPPQGANWTFVAPRVVRKFMRDKPAALSMSGAFVVREALIAEYPCRAR